MVSKITLRDTVVANKEQFELTGNNDYIFKATIYYAIYKAIKGNKLVPLPPFTDVIYKTVYVVASIKAKTGNRITGNILSKARDEILSEFKNVKDIEYVRNGNESWIKLDTIKDTYTIQLTKDIARVLSEIAILLISEQDFQKVRVDKNLIYITIYNGLSNIGRCAR